MKSENKTSKTKIQINKEKLPNCIFDIFKRNPAVTTTITIAICIRELCSSKNNTLKPFSAYKADLERFFSENFSEPFLLISGNP